MSTSEIHTVFISYSHDSESHLQWALRFANRLQSESDISVVFDQYELWPGKDVTRFMERGLTTDKVVLILTSEYARKAQERIKGTGYETTIISGQIAEGTEEDKFIPVFRESPETCVPSFMKNTLGVDMCRDAEFESGINEVLRGIRREPSRSSIPNITTTRVDFTTKGPLEPKISERGLWRLLQQASVKAVVAGGVEAMTFYRRPAEAAEFTWLPRVSSKNPTTTADIAATADALQAIHQRLSKVAARCSCTLKYLAEDAVVPESLSGLVPEEILDHIKSPEEFFTKEENEIRVILDAIDGTGSFAMGIPLFCSAVAILVGTRPRVAAIYDPIHHIVYSATLRPDAEAFAQAWSVSGSERLDLRHAFTDALSEKGPFEAPIGIHISRTNRDIVKTWAQSNGGTTLLQDLSDKFGSIYAFNSGLLAMKYIAEGGLGAFLNPETNLWDIAPGEVLLNACGGRVTNMEGHSIDYSRYESTSIIAARESVYERCLSSCRNHAQ